MKKDQEEIIEIYSYWEDIQCEAVFTLHKREFGQSLDFAVYEVLGESEGERYYEGKGGCGWDDKATTDIKNANTLFRGYIKWDACSHVYFGDDDGYIHVCGFHSWKNLHEAIKRVWNFATECEFSEDDFLNKLPPKTE